VLGAKAGTRPEVKSTAGFWWEILEARSLSLPQPTADQGRRNA
jgi:hypothetical protein